MTVAVELVADHPHLIPVIGEMCWKEWAEEELKFGAPRQVGEVEWWVKTAAREAGREALPISWAAIDEEGGALGRVGLGEFDLEERKDRSPWVLGMIVEGSRRERGIGRQLLRVLEVWAGGRGYPQVWVATGDQAVDFYRRCGWELTETFSRQPGDVTHVLTKQLGADVRVG